MVFWNPIGDYYWTAPDGWAEWWELLLLTNRATVPPIVTQVTTDDFLV